MAKIAKEEMMQAQGQQQQAPVSQGMENQALAQASNKQAPTATSLAQI
jgi:hypothetical protein